VDPILGLRYPITVPDNQLTVVGSSDASKKTVWEVDTQGTGLTFTWDVGAQTGSRTLTVPVLAGTDTIMTLATAQTVSGAKTFSSKMTSTAGLGLEILGAAASLGNGPDLRFKFNGDPDAVISFFAYDHGNVALTFDNYFNGALWVASAPEAFQIYKVGSNLKFYGNSGLTKGSSYTPVVILTLSAAGILSLANTTASTSTATGSLVNPGGFGNAGQITGGAAILSVGPTAGIGYATGAGGAVTQITGRTTGVTLNAICGEITLVSAAGSATWQSFTVTSSAMAATDNVIVNQKSGTDLNMIHVTAKAGGSFRVSFATTGGTTVEQPVFGFSIIKAVNA